MSEIVLYSVLSIGGLGTIMAVVLYVVAQRFKVIEDPRIDLVEEKLPAANCGGCGYAGCRNFAEEIVKAGNLDGFNCPPGGSDAMNEIASVLGLVAEEQEPMVAVVRCSGSVQAAPPKTKFQGLNTCSFAHSLYAGQSGCPYGCLGEGDCVVSCAFDAMYMDQETGLPVVIEENCVACGACVKACPRAIIELRKKGKKSRRIFVSCINKEKGAVARKNCVVACIGCGKCVKECKFDAITLENYLAYIDFEKCVLCRKCAPECPTNAIHEVNFPPKKVKEQQEESTKES